MSYLLTPNDGDMVFCEFKGTGDIAEWLFDVMQACIGMTSQEVIDAIRTHHDKKGTTLPSDWPHCYQNGGSLAKVRDGVVK